MSTESKQLTNYYLVLDIRRNATADDIEMAYARAALKHHPDVAGDTPEVQERFALINEAYSVLSNPEKKRTYDDQLGFTGMVFQEEVISSDEGRTSSSEPVTSSSEPVNAESPARAPQPEKKASAGGDAAGRMSRKRFDRVMSNARKLIAKGDFWRADSILRQAVFSYPSDPELRRLLARAAEGRGRFREAVEELKAASEAEYFNPENHALMGRMYMKGGQYDRAVKAFHDALSWQEDYKPALNGLAEIKRLRRAGLPWWKKLLGKKL